MMELTQRRIAASRVPVAPANQQSRLVIALVLLLFALAAVLIKDRQFWFGSEQTIVDANDYQPTATPQSAPQAPTQAAAPTQTAAPTSTKPVAQPVVHATAPAAKKQVPATTIPSQTKPAEAPAPAVVTNRTVLPPLDVQVVAGNTHRDLHPRSNATKIQISQPAASVARQAAPVAAPTTNAAQRERLAEAIPPSYPPLAQHMNVQGSVVLQALIAADGSIQNLHVISGPQILATAAQQAVREWRFKPVYQNGQAVETRATITVSFTIRVNDSSVNTTLAESRDNDVIISQR
jgi:periplasmic protein TonB